MTEHTRILAVEIAEMRRLAKKATKTPWQHKNFVAVIFGTSQYAICHNDTPGKPLRNPNAAFIVRASPDVITDWCDALESAYAEIERLNGGGWIACSHRLPESRGIYQTFNSELQHGGTSWYNEKTAHWECVSQPILTFVTHWQPLPASPTGGAQ